MKYFDIHCHLNDGKFEHDLPETIARMKNAGVASLVVGTDLAMSRKAAELAREEASLYAVVGLHPTDTDEAFDEKAYRELLQEPKVVAIGECGLDYFHIKEDTRAEREKQMNVFERQLELAVETNKPLMVHCRDAHEDILSVLESKKKEYGEKLRGNIHFFTAGTETAKRYFDIDFTVSFTGVLTFARDYDEVVQYAPLSCIMSETDAPYVAPVPYRGKRNEPAHVALVVKKIAEIREEEIEIVRKTLVENAVRVFGLG